MSESVIVVHGLWLPGLETKLLRHRLQVAGFKPLLFQFPTLRGTLAQNVQDLAEFAAQVPGEKLHFVGYSLGGVVTLSMLAERKQPQPGRIVCLGSPLTGCSVAKRISASALGRAIVGRSLLEHTHRGGIMQWEQKSELGIIAGARSLGIGRLVAQLPGANDGTVARVETEIPGATAHLTLPVTHTQLLFDRTVARQTIHFLRHGSFAA